jgi:3-Oxoacyl-[acyl-carrier-protein (ACP)] synthase III
LQAALLFALAFQILFPGNRRSATPGETGQLGDVGPCRAGRKRGPPASGTQTRKHRSYHCRYDVTRLHHARHAGIFDVDCACASFPALIAVASGLIATTAMKTILVVGVDMIHKLTDPNDPGCFLWSDGAGAAVLEGGTNRGFIGAVSRRTARMHQAGVSLRGVPSSPQT